MDAREYLEQIHSNKSKIRALQIQREYWLDLAKGTTAKVGDVRVQSSGSKQSMAAQMVEVVSIDEQIAECKQIIAECMRLLNKLRSKEFTFLHKVYVQNLSLKEVSFVYNKSYSWAKTTHYRALAKFQEILDEEMQKCNHL